MMNNEVDLNSVLYDFRKDIVKRKHKSIKINWKDWDNWNILYKTMAYELSCSRDVENYKYVKEKAFNSYCSDYAENYKTADIMNGWWYCFKCVFNIEKSRNNKETIKFKEDLMKEIKELNDCQVVDFLCKKYGKEKQLYDIFLKYLKVVYTTGNITPSHENTNRGSLDNWEIKLEKYRWNSEDEEKLYFKIYRNIESVNEVDDSNLEKYMKGRIDLILRRALLLKKCTEKNIEEILNELKKRIVI